MVSLFHVLFIVHVAKIDNFLFSQNCQSYINDVALVFPLIFLFLIYEAAYGGRVSMTA